MKGKDGGAAKVLRREWVLRRLPRWGRGVRRRVAPLRTEMPLRDIPVFRSAYFRKEYTVLFAPKRSTSRFAALTLRVSSHRNIPLECSGVAHGLFE